MKSIQSHYEILKVARDAPLEVIRAAYRVLAQKYHPDVNRSADAPKIMATINEAWRVLGDPALRAQHDAMLRATEASQQASTGQQAEESFGAKNGAAPPRSAAGSSSSSKNARPSPFQPFGRATTNTSAGAPNANSPLADSTNSLTLPVALVLVVAFVGWEWMDRSSQVRTDSPSQTSATPLAGKPEQFPLSLGGTLFIGTNERPQYPFSSSAQKLEYQAWAKLVNERLESALPAKDRTDLIEAVWYESHRAGIDLALTLALAEKLSRFDPSLKNSSGAVGYLQVGQTFSSQFAPSDPAAFVPVRINLRAGLTLFRYFLNLSNGNLVVALQKYRSQSLSPNVQPTDEETRLFATQVLEASDSWRAPIKTDGPSTRPTSDATIAEALPNHQGNDIARATEARDTGYLPNEPQSASEGRSTFTVDNRSSSGDAVVRLYLNDQQPPVRSIFVRKGESFSMNALSAGSYALRYRFSDRRGTFKANQLFSLTEQRTYDGVRYSNLRVTLYTVQNGNLSMKPVPDDEF